MANMVTYLEESDKNRPTSSWLLNSYLVKAKLKTQRDWQAVERKFEIPRLFRKPRVRYLYMLAVAVDDSGKNYRMIHFPTEDPEGWGRDMITAEVAVSYLMGVLNDGINYDHAVKVH